MLSPQQIRDIVREAVHETLTKLNAIADGALDKIQPGDKSRLLSRQAAADVLGVSVQTIAKLIADGTLPHKRVRRRVLVPQAAITAYLKSIGQDNVNGGDA